MNTVIAHVLPDDTTSITCPSCSRVRRISVKKYIKTSHSVTARCACKTKFTIHLDFRHYYRKETNLPGLWKKASSAVHGWQNMRIKNLSRGGLGFRLSGQHQLEEKQILLVEFHLDGRKKTKIVQKVRVCTVDEGYIGCKFVDVDFYDEKELGFYLLA
ncbi:PilZ domain-containing protein [Candidatus Electrothrix marina]|uniref:PilZ domain-containing protein n=1 Tax=Candidatus Electrothrix marina TaxID=1859130 RepID=A0A444J7F0_9BACT|nr:PilZ domain-containing protein [Candidatus Electrothrix marina]